MDTKLLILAAVLALTAGCLRNQAYERPFTKEWVHQVSSERDFADRQARTTRKELVLMGKEGGTRAAVETDDEGKTRLNFGKKSGLSADVKMRSGAPDVGLKYKLKWKAARPKKESQSND